MLCTPIAQALSAVKEVVSVSLPNSVHTELGRGMALATARASFWPCEFGFCMRTSQRQLDRFWPRVSGDHCRPGTEFVSGLTPKGPCGQLLKARGSRRPEPRWFGSRRLYFQPSRCSKGGFQLWIGVSEAVWLVWGPCHTAVARWLVPQGELSSV